jgi:LacI family transcriptional regulator
MGAPPRVAVFVDMPGGYGRGLLTGISNYVRAHRPWRLFGDPERAVAPVFDLASWDGDGLIIHLHTRELEAMARATGVPCVNVSGRMLRTEVPTVLPDNRAVGRLVATHFLERGFRQFAYTGFTGHGYAITRGNAFRATLESAGHECLMHESPAPREGARGSWERQQSHLRAWVEALPRPVAVMACNDVRARQVAQICEEAGLRVPEDIALVGSDNDELICELSNPPLSSVDLAIERVGYQAAAMLDALMSGQPPPDAPVLVPPAGVITRRSSDLLAIDDADVADAVRYIRDHAAEPVQVNDVVNATAVSRRVLERRFKRVLGHTVGDYLARTHVDRAAQLLIHTDLSMADIAARCGFNYIQQFNAVFKRHLHQTPRAYRNQHRVR